MKKNVVNKLTDKLEPRLVRVIGKTLMNVMETVDIKHNMSTITGAFSSATREMMISMLNDDWRMKRFPV